MNAQRVDRLEMPRFSLVVATLGRTRELSILLESLAKQEFRDFELIIIDQNSDDRLCPLLEGWSAAAARRDGAVTLKHLRCAPGVSRARNLGLAESRGEILGFPDDDCWYMPETLLRVDEWFRNHGDYGILCIGCRDERGLVSSNSWWQNDCELHRINVFRTSAACTCFVRRPAADVSLLFDERIGPGAGTLAGCGEDADFVMTLLDQGVRGRFNSLLHVGHPRREGGFQDEPRARRYGGGFGWVLAKHSCHFLFVGFVLFDFVRALAHAAAGHRKRAWQLWAHLRGLGDGYFEKK